jgi:hypothetical protein
MKLDLGRSVHLAAPCLSLDHLSAVSKISDVIQNIVGIRDVLFADLLWESWGLTPEDLRNPDAFLH